MTKLTIVANITVKPEHINTVKEELLKLIPITRSEEGCLQYDLHQDNDNPSHFKFYENWSSRELWQIHMKNKHISDYMAATDGMVTDFVVNEMTLID